MNFKRTAALVASTSLVFGLSGCGRDLAPVAGMNGFGAFGAQAAAKVRRARANETAGTWTILVHMGADNNLYSFGLENLNEMEAGLTTDKVQVIVLFDGVKNGDSCIYRIKHDPAGNNQNIISEKLDDAGAVIPPSTHEINSGDVNVLNKFTAWALKKFPADHSALMIWDHGSGLFDGRPNPITRGFSWDDNGTHMSTRDLTSITATVKATTGKPLDILGFDACLMSHVELAYQMAGNANYLVASEQLEPGAGMDYLGWMTALSKLADSNQATPAAVAASSVDAYVNSYLPGGIHSNGGRDQATFAATDINALMTGLVPALNNFVAVANKNIAADKAMFTAARSHAMSYYNTDCADLGSFMANVKATSQDAAVNAAVAAVQSAYAQTVVREAHTKNENGSTGLVMYFPNGQGINSVYNDPSQIAFAKESWRTFLQNFNR